VVLRSTSVRAGQRFPEPLAPLPLIECVAVWALKLPVPHTDVLKPTSHNVFFLNYWNPNKLSLNICYKQIILEFNSLNKKALETTFFVVFSAF